MKIIKANKITSITASSENPNFPATNLYNGEVSEVFRSVAAAPAIATITLTIALPAGVNNAIGIFGCNSTSIAYAVKDVTEATTYFSGTLDTTPSSPARTLDHAGATWTSNGAALHVILTLTAPTDATYHEVGEIVAGETISLPDPARGLKQGRANYQTIQRKAGGGRYVHDGPKPRVFNLSWGALTRESEFDDLDELYESVGESPVAMLLSDTLSNIKWWGFFHMTSDPGGSHDSPVYSPTTLSIEEAV